MLYITSSQIFEFPFMALAGMLMYLAAMLFGILRRLICAGMWLSTICDIFLGIVWAVILCIGVTAAAHGRIRAYHLLAAISGAAVIRLALHASAAELFSRVAKQLKIRLPCLKTNPFIRALFR